MPNGDKLLPFSTNGNHLFNRHHLNFKYCESEIDLRFRMIEELI